MRRRTPIFSAFGPVISSGLQPDRHPALQVLWEAAENVWFYSERVKRRAPGALVFDLVDKNAPALRGLMQQRLANGTRRFWAAGHRSDAPTFVSAYYWDGVGSSAFGADIANAQLNENSLAPATFVDFTALGDWMVVNGGTAKARLFKPGVGNSAPAEWPALAVQYQKKGPFLLALGTGGRKTGVAWSDGDNWETFTPSASNLAGELFIDDMDTGIVAGTRLGSGIACYSEDQLAMVSYVGAPFHFGQKVLLDGIGAVGKFSVVSDGRQNFGVGRNGIWWTDGNSVRYIDEGFLRDYLQEGVNWNQSSKVIAARNDVRGLVGFSFPMGVATENTETWWFDPRTGGWTKAGPVAVWDERRLLVRPLRGTADGKVLLDDYAPELGGALVLRTKPLLLQVQDELGLRDVHTDTRVDEVVLTLKAATGIEWRYGVASAIDAVFDWSPWTAASAGQATYSLPALPSGVYHKLELRSTVTDWALDLQGFQLFGQVEGSKRGVA